MCSFFRTNLDVSMKIKVLESISDLHTDRFIPF